MKELPETKAKLSTMRANKKIRDDRFKLVLQKNFGMFLHLFSQHRRKELTCL